MAKRQLQQLAPFGLGDFEIMHPFPGESMPLLAGNTIEVVVNNNDENQTLVAAIFQACGSDNTPLPELCYPVDQGSGITKSGLIPVLFLDPFDILQDHKRVVVYGHIDGIGYSAGVVHSFRIERGASGSLGGSGSGSQRPCTYCSAQPVPVFLILRNSTGAIENDTACGQCEALNADFPMQHSDDPCLSCCWFSGPVDFCGDGSMGYWALEKKDARLWELGVYYSIPGSDSFPIVRYHFSTGADNVCTFPITLTLDEESVDDACMNWPATIVVEAAP